MSDTEDRAATIYQYAHLSEMSPEWAEVAHQHEEIQKLADALYSLPLQEFRRVPYKSPALPKNVPVPDRDLTIEEDMVVVRDGYAIAIRIYQPLDQKENHPLFFNIHGGGASFESPTSMTVLVAYSKSY
jgi:acetyl esterase/lipase